MSDSSNNATNSALSILVVDDDELNQRMMRLLLKRDGHSVECVSNGLEAYNAVKTQSFDMILMDLQMPVMDGVEVARRLQANKSPVHILVLSAYDDRQYILEMLNMGAAGYLIKDEAPEVIVDAVQGIASGEKGWISRKAAVRLQR
jgi:CheY-like chemotaxis protein